MVINVTYSGDRVGSSTAPIANILVGDCDERLLPVMANWLQSVCKYARVYWYEWSYDTMQGVIRMQSKTHMYLDEYQRYVNDDVERFKILDFVL